MIEIVACSKSFSARADHPPMPALQAVTATIRAQEFVCLLGPSGCGKTTLLKLVAGLLRPDAGEIRINGTPIQGPGPERAMVFQNFALLPWADVLTNVAFGLELRGVDKAARLARARTLLREVGLGEFAHHYPRQLSGGMQQRVGLARALAVNPAILLMDEPFGALDEQTRRLLQEELTRLHEAAAKTVLFVTHSMDEAVRLSDSIILMTPRPGRIHEIIPVPFTRPRPPDLEADPRFGELKTYLWHQLRAMQTLV